MDVSLSSPLVNKCRGYNESILVCLLFLLILLLLFLPVCFGRFFLQTGMPLEEDAPLRFSSTSSPSFCSTEMTPSTSVRSLHYLEPKFSWQPSSRDVQISSRSLEVQNYSTGSEFFGSYRFKIVYICFSVLGFGIL